MIDINILQQQNNLTIIDGQVCIIPLSKRDFTTYPINETAHTFGVTTGSFQNGSGMYTGSATKQHAIVSNAYPTRITFTLAQESPQTSDLTQLGEYLTIGDNSSVRASIDRSSNNINFVTTIKGNRPNSKAFYTGKAVTLTKVEQYY